MHSSSFSVAGMSGAASTHHNINHGPNAWGGASSSGSLTTSLTDTLSQSRIQYQPGYMMSAAQGNTLPQGSQRIDEVPVVQTKAKMNHVLSRGLASDFGMESMFESSRQRQTLPDEDAPPMNSVNDIPSEIRVDSSPARFQPRNSTHDNSPFPRRHSRQPSIPPPSQMLYIIVFGYPADKYSVTVEYFKSLGDTTEPELNNEILNCFRLGYKEPGDAMRAVRKNGEVLAGSWMVGAKWADPAQAEALLGNLASRGSLLPSLPDLGSLQSPNPMSVDDLPSPTRGHMSTTPTIGTPIRLAPSTSAFRKAGQGEKSGVQPQQRAPVAGMGNVGVSVAGSGGAIQQSPSKSMIGQVSDLIFGW